MILYKFFAIAFLILTPIFAFIIHRFFSLKYLGGYHYHDSDAEKNTILQV